ncbi:MAG: Na+/H+ antiporter NhaA [Thermoleophilia bacterium]
MTPRLRPPIAAVVRPFQQFAKIQASQGILLLFCTAAALIWANSPWSHLYDSFWHTEIAVDVGGWILEKSLLHWINDGLMVVFFFVVGLEIKREILAGELASPRKAALPIAAALGGMAAPALIFLAFTWGGEGAQGWGVPMATDIAFALGVLTLVGKRIPVGLKVFLVALAIVDDIGAVLVIAVFYSEGVSLAALGAGAGVLGLLVIMNWSGVRHTLVYGALGVALWLCFLLSGVHPTVAGILLAMTVPARSNISSARFTEKVRELLTVFDHSAGRATTLLGDERRQAAALEIEDMVERVGVPLIRFEHGLQPWVAFFIMPLFALANAGVPLGGDLLGQLRHPVSLGIICGLVAGKQIGILIFSATAVRSGYAERPPGVGWGQIYGAGWLGGIGFTMALFIAGLAFEGTALLDAAKTAILLASAVAGVVGWAILRLLIPLARVVRSRGVR